MWTDLEALKRLWLATREILHALSDERLPSARATTALRLLQSTYLDVLPNVRSNWPELAERASSAPTKQSPKGGSKR